MANPQGGKSLTAKFQQALNKALKQAEYHDNRKSLDVLLADLMQDDVAKFMQVASPYLPKELIIDAGINLIDIINQANQRTLLSINELAPDRLTSIAPTNIEPVDAEFTVIDVNKS